MGVERRIKAAQVLGGFKSLDDLAAAIGREDSGMSRKTLRRIASDTDPRQAKDYELEWIAAACGVPLSFLTEDLRPGGTQLDQIVERLDELIQGQKEISLQIETAIVLAASGQTLDPELDEGAEARRDAIQVARRLAARTERSRQGPASLDG